MTQSKKCTAINALLFSALMLASALAAAGGASEHTNANAGTVIHASGPLLASGTDGTTRVLVPKSAVHPGETLITQKNSYAQIRFSDGSLLILQPATALTINAFSYDAGKPEDDKIILTLQQGGLRSNAGLLGKRSKDRVTVNTPAGVVGLENASAIIQFQPENASATANKIAQRTFLFTATAALDASLTTTRTDAPLPAAGLVIAQLNVIMPDKAIPIGPGPSPSSMPQPGLYVQVIDGMVHLSNGGGTQNFAAGQFGFVPGQNLPPVILPQNPGIKFSPPPVFNASLPTANPAGPAKSAPIDCEVR